MTYRSTTRGFALPVIMLVSLSLMIIALSMLQSSSSVRATIDDQYYDRLASEAAQSGITAAVGCLSSNNYMQSWPKTSPMTEQQDCMGANVSPSVTLSSQPNIRGSYSVGNIDGVSDGAVLVTSMGTVQRLADGTNTSVRTYTKTLKRIASSAYVKFSNLAFGYYRTNPTGAYYFVRGSDNIWRAAGGNYFGQLGTGNYNNVLKPTPISAPNGQAITAFYTNFLSQGYQVFFTTTDGSIYGMGAGDRGQLGNGDTSGFKENPQRFQLPAGKTTKYVALLGNATYVLTNDNLLYAAGDCTLGELGVGMYPATDDCNTYQSVPAKVLLPDPDPRDPNTIPVADMIADADTAYIRTQGGRVYGWGQNRQGQLGTGDYTNVNAPVAVGTQPNGSFGNPGQPKAAKIAFDGVTFYVLDTNGKVWVTGNNSFGQLGINSTADGINSFQQINFPAGSGVIKDISTDQWHVLFLTASGDVYGAGYNKTGQLGNNRTSNAERALVKFNLPGGVKGRYIYVDSAGYDFDNDLNNSYVVGSDGLVYGAGSNAYGQLGIGTTQKAVQNPVAMSVIDGKSIRAKTVVSGLGSTIVLTTKGTYYTVGNNNTGQLGTGDTMNRQTPVKALFLQPASSSFVF